MITSVTYDTGPRGRWADGVGDAVAGAFEYDHAAELAAAENGEATCPAP